MRSGYDEEEITDWSAFDRQMKMQFSIRHSPKSLSTSYRRLIMVKYLRSTGIFELLLAS
jgi:hypothetical protein